MRCTMLTLVLFLFCTGLFAQGRIIIPEPPAKYKRGQVYLQKVKADVRLKQGAATVDLEQEFFNDSPLRLEGEYLFAIPDKAQIYDFNLYINGKKTKGQILSKDEAAGIYEDIVRKMRDPALLEYTGYGLFKARVYPVESRQTRKIELSYTQIIDVDGETFRFTLPIRQSGQGRIDHFNLIIDLRTEEPLANIYSPSHKVDIERINARHVRIEANQENLEADKDFILYYSLADREINGTLLSFRPRTDRDGYFLWMVSPKYGLEQTKTVAKDIVFVLDVSGSMAGEKIEQAKDALKFCMNALRKNDRFAIVSFSSAVRLFRDELSAAGREEIKNAQYFIRNLSANGGTNINEALLRALRIKKKNDRRPTSVVFLTDGLPTEGERNIGRILRNIKDEQKDFVRIFSFGVGFDVNTYLLDKLSKDGHGSANYVKPGENIEREVGKFFARISAPVLTNTALTVDGGAVYDIFPGELPDIFKGQRVTVFGRYSKAGRVKIKLSGEQSKKSRIFNYEAELKNREENNEFIAKLWANRKVSHLLTQIRFNGENPELVKSIKSLAEEYGIVTPYTSYLVREQNKEIARYNMILGQGAGGASGRRFMARQRARALQAEKDEEDLASQTFYKSMSTAPKGVMGSSGKGAVMSSRAMKKVAELEQDREMITTVKRVCDKTFFLKEGVWVEKGLEKKTEQAKKITFLSDDYFELAKSDKQLRKILALGEKLVFEWDGRIYQIVVKDK